jgi:subtilisin family serine protease
MYSCAASAVIEVPTFHPDKPEATQQVTMVVVAGGCTSFSDGPDEADVTVQGTKIEVVIDGIHEDAVGTICNIPFKSYTFRLGKFPPGQYEVHISVHDVPPFPSTASVRIAPLTVVPATARVAIPATTPVALAFLLALLLLTSRGKGLPAIVITLACVPVARSEEPALFGVAVLLADGPTKPADLVEDYRFAGSNEPRIAGLAVGDPVRADFLSPDRPRGDYADWLAQHPDSDLAKLERYVVVQYRSLANAEAGLTALRTDPEVAFAHALPEYRFSSSPSVAKAAPYWRTALGANSSAEPRGWALIGELDSGIATDHVLLREYHANGSLSGGGFRAALSYDFGHKGVRPLEGNVDELQPEPVLAPDVACDFDHDGYLVAASAGHGTHVAGLMVGAAADTAGLCPGCSLAVSRIVLLRCEALVVTTRLNVAAVLPALKHLTAIGAQVINQSFGHSGYLVDDFCLSNSNDAQCLQIHYMASREVALVAASGNDRTRLDFPARDPRVIAVGGVDASLALWDEDTVGPNLTDGCPTPGSSRECGSNYTLQPVEPKQGFVAPARGVLSTVYPGVNWSTTGACGDAFGTPLGDGIGNCTGTSMSAPMIAGIIGAIRSANPLLTVAQVKGLLISASVRPDGGTGWSPKLGYGIPQRDVAVQLALGRVGKQPLHNRMTPLFTLYSAGALDRAATASPQFAMALMLGPAQAWTPTGAPVAGYPAFATAFADVPRAEAYVFTTEHSPFPDRPLVPLRALRRARPWPAGCSGVDPGCAVDHVDHVLSTDDAEIPLLVASGYEYLGTQGYLIARCAPSPACVPAGAVEMLRLCRASDDDCAIFPRSAEASYSGLGYTTPLGTQTILGYAYPNSDQDGDTLIDGFETWLGLDPALPDSDKDGVPDGLELPLAATPVSDPCPRGLCDKSFVFADGYE